MNFGIMQYGTYNIGDEIQSLAASRFIPNEKIAGPYFIDRENMKNFYSKENIKVILNGWYMHSSKEWPPSKCIIPLLISMHINQNSIKNMLSVEGEKFFREYGPVGTRDLATLDLLKNKNIPSYFSGCLTLTLPKFDGVEKSDYILAVDISNNLLKFLQDKTDRPIYVVSPCMPFFEFLNQKEKFVLAEYILRLYQGAHCVITSRLHAAMPCLALETPVMLINDAIDQYRFDGLRELVRNETEDNYKGNYSLFDINKPGLNSNDYLKHRERLISICEKFTGVEAKKSININGHLDIGNLNSLLMSILSSKNGMFFVKKFAQNTLKTKLRLQKFKV